MKNLVNGIFILLILFKVNESLAAWLPVAPPKTKLCGRCHGDEGKSTNPRYPKLAGQHKDYLIKQLHNFQVGQQGPRNNPLMMTIANQLSDTDIIQLASYFAYQQPSIGSAQKATLDLGRRLYQGGDRKQGIPACSACHGPAGEGNPSAKFPRLAGQHPRYIVRQLQNFQLHQRHNDPQQIMQDIASKMSPEQMAAVANYVSGVHD